MTFVLLIYDLKIPASVLTNVQEYAGSTVITNNYNTEIHDKIKSAMHAKGYASAAHTTKSRLPHNCLVKDNTSQQQAIADIIEVAKKHDVALDSYITVNVNGSYQADASLL